MGKAFKRSHLLLMASFVCLIWLVSCTKSGSLTGTSSSSSFGGSINGSVNGGLSPVAGATVTLYGAAPGGSPTVLATATTGSNGAYNLAFSNPGGNNLLYITAAGGNAGSGTNANNQFMTIIGTTGSFQSSQPLNELTTSGAELTAMNMGLLTDTSGSIAISSPKNSAGANNISTQFFNLITNANLNTANANLGSSTQTGLKVMANMFASCIENSSNCSKLLNAASTSSGTAAASLLEAGYNALVNSSNNSNSLYTLAFPLNSNTGFSLTSASMPNGFSFNNALAVPVNTFGGTNGPVSVAVDSSGNIWITNFNGNSVSEYNASASLLGTFSGLNGPAGIAIDNNGNLWISNFNNHTVSEMNSSGTVIGTFSGGGSEGMAVDTAGNIYAADHTAHTVVKYSPSGTVLLTIAIGVSSPGPFDLAFDASGNLWTSNQTNLTISRVNPSAGTVTGKFSINGSGSILGLAFDPSGNLWVPNGAGNVIEFSSLGAQLNAFSTGLSTSRSIVIDSSGDLWIGGGSAQNNISELSSSGVTLATYVTPSTTRGMAIDSLGNLWSSSGAFFLPAVSNGPQFFPYSGPVYPSCGI